MPIEARLQVASTADRRGRRRRKISLGSSLEASGEVVTIHDVSSTGMLIETSPEFSAVGPLEIDLPEAGMTQAVVVWNSGQFYGCEFKKPISQAAISAALLRSPPARLHKPEPALPIQELAERIISRTKEDSRRDLLEENKAPYAVRLRVILGAALVLWTLLIWGAISLYKVLQPAFE
jgi:hypothetical protein